MAAAAAVALPAAERQVSQSDRTLLEEIAAGAIPQPELQEFNDWQRWRRDVGRRPTAATDGRATTSRAEVDLWRATMVHFYGADWPADLALLRAEPDGVPAEPLVAPVPVTAAVGPGSAAASTDGGAYRSLTSPGSGRRSNPDSGAASPPPTPSWHSSRPGTYSHESSCKDLQGISARQRSHWSL